MGFISGLVIGLLVGGFVGLRVGGLAVIASESDYRGKKK